MPVTHDGPVSDDADPAAIAAVDLLAAIERARVAGVSADCALGSVVLGWGLDDAELWALLGGMGLREHSGCCAARRSVSGP